MLSSDPLQILCLWGISILLNIFQNLFQNISLSLFHSSSLLFLVLNFILLSSDCILATLNYFEVSQCPQSCPHCGLSRINEDVKYKASQQLLWHHAYIDRLLLVLYPRVLLFAVSFHSDILSRTIFTLFLKLQNFYSPCVFVPLVQRCNLSNTFRVIFEVS